MVPPHDFLYYANQPMENTNGSQHSGSDNGLPAANGTAGNFDLRAKSLAITYPQCKLSKEMVLSHLGVLHKDAVYIIVAAETHKDGNPHLHACVLLPKPFRTKRARFWDLEGFHPNVQGIRSIPKWLDYIKKVTQSELF